MLEASPTKVKEPTSGNRSIINLFGEGLTLRVCKGDITSYSWLPPKLNVVIVKCLEIKFHT